MLRIAAFYFLAIGLGIALASATHANSATPAVAAANHCTRYAPTVVVDGICNDYGSLQPSNLYSTPSNGLRDNNHIEFERCTNHWYIQYVGGNGNVADGIGCAGTIGPSNGYAQSKCHFTGVTSQGVCRTNWHD
jgi:hypothetical protein